MLIKVLKPLKNYVLANKFLSFSKNTKDREALFLLSRKFCNFLYNHMSYSFTYIQAIKLFEFKN